MNENIANSILELLKESLNPVSDSQRRVYVSLLERGRLLEFLEDAKMLSPSERKSKWDYERNSEIKSQLKQYEEGQKTLQTSLNRLKNREINRNAWRHYVKHSSCASPMLNLPEEDLLLKPPTFWYEFPLEDLSDELTRATMGRLEELFEKFGRGRFPKSVWQRYDEHMVRLPFLSQGTNIKTVEINIPNQETMSAREEDDKMTSRCATQEEKLTSGPSVVYHKTKSVCCCCSLFSFGR